MKTTILVVEDDHALAEALSDTLELEGYGVLHAADGEQALALLQDVDVTLVLSDVHMERMDGYTLLQRLRLQRPDLPVVKD